MVHAFDKVGFKPQVKAGHERGQEDDETRKRVFGMPSLGVVNKIYRDGKTLFADITNVPKRFANLIKARTFSRVSSEIYWNFKNENTGKTYPRVLKAVAFLGAEVPALTSLKEIEALFTLTDGGGLHAYDQNGYEFRAYDFRPYHGDGTHDESEHGNWSEGGGGGTSGTGGGIKPSGSRFKGKVRGIETDDHERILGNLVDKDDVSEGEMIDYLARRGGMNGEKAHDFLDRFKKKNPDATRSEKKQAILKLVTSKGGKRLYADASMTIEEEDGKFCVYDEDDEKVASFPTREEAEEYVEEEGETAVEETKPKPYQDKQQQVKTYMIRKKGDQWCVLTHDGSKTLGCHDSEEDAKAQLSAVEANKHGYSLKQTAEGDPGREGGRQMTDEQFEEKMKEREAQLKADLVKDFQYRIDKAREEGKAEVERENELLRESITKLEREKRGDRIEHWIKNLKQDGKLMPVEESRVRALRLFLNDEDETQLKYYALKEGKPTEFKESPVKIFESLFNDRRTNVFTKQSTEDGEDQEQELSDPGAEVDRRVKAYKQKQAEKSITVSYGDALSYVLRQDRALADRYNRTQQ